MKNAEDRVKRLIARMEEMRRKTPSTKGFSGLEDLYIPDGIDKLRCWLNQREAGNEDDDELLDSISYGGLVCGPQFYRSESNKMTKWGTLMRHRGIANRVRHGYASGKYRTVTAARRAVAEHDGISLRTVYNAEKNARKKR
ncbi:MAG: hypothetical protein ACOC7K_00640 [bacterium]